MGIVVGLITWKNYMRLVIRIKIENAENAHAHEYDGNTLLHNMILITRNDTIIYKGQSQ